MTIEDLLVRLASADEAPRIVVEARWDGIAGRFTVRHQLWLGDVLLGIPDVDLSDVRIAGLWPSSAAPWGSVEEVRRIIREATDA